MEVRKIGSNSSVWTVARGTTHLAAGLCGEGMGANEKQFQCDGARDGTDIRLKFYGWGVKKKVL